MIIDTLRGDELTKVWNWLVDEPALHFDDFGPKTFEQFVEYMSGLEGRNIIMFAVRKGKKLVGAVGFSPEDAHIKGMVFDESERGTGLPVSALRVLLLMLWKVGIKDVTFRYFASNRRMPGFLRKLGAKFIGLDGHTTQGGVPVQFAKWVVNAPVPENERLSLG